MRSARIADVMSAAGTTRLVPQIICALAIVAAPLLSGCSSFPPDGGMEAVQATAGAELKKDVVALRTEDSVVDMRARGQQLLKRPLSAYGVVQIALLNNRDLQAAYNELGLAEAARIAVSLPPSPRFSFEHVAGGGGLDIERRIVADILALATLPARAEIAADRFRQAQLHAAEATLRIAAETRRAYYRAVAARALLSFFV